MLRTLRSLLRSNRGTSSIEFGLLAPGLAILLTGTWDFGTCYLEQQRLASAARAGAQYGIQTASHALDFAGMIQAARNDAADTANALDVTAQQLCYCPNGTTVSCSGNCSGAPEPRFFVKLVVSENYSTLFPYPFVSNPISLSSEVTMRQQ